MLFDISFYIRSYFFDISEERLCVHKYVHLVLHIYTIYQSILSVVMQPDFFRQFFSGRTGLAECFVIFLYYIFNVKYACIYYPVLYACFYLELDVISLSYIASKYLVEIYIHKCTIIIFFLRCKIKRSC